MCAWNNETNVCMCESVCVFFASVSGDKQIQLSMNVYIDFEYSHRYFLKQSWMEKKNQQLEKPWREWKMWIEFYGQSDFLLLFFQPFSPRTIIIRCRTVWKCTQPKPNKRVWVSECKIFLCLVGLAWADHSHFFVIYMEMNAHEQINYYWCTWNEHTYTRMPRY